MENRFSVEPPKKEFGYVVDDCSHPDRTLAVRVSFFIHNGRVYPHPARYRCYRDYFASH